MKVLVTGAAGFLGSHLTAELLKRGNSVVGVDDLTTGNMDNLEQQLQDSNFQFLNHDIREPLNISIDAILNFACPASPVHYQKDPVKTIETNFLGMSNMLKLATKYRAKVVQASTSEVYGDPEISPQNEEYWGNVNPAGIRSCYDEGKRAAETLCFDYKRNSGVDARVIRIFNTYGPKMALSDGRVVSNFIVQALRGENITVYGKGDQTRSFCYVDDLVNGILKVLESKNGFNGAINLGNPHEFTMLELASKVQELTSSKSEVIFENLPLDDPKQRKPDISKALKELNWEPKVDLIHGLGLTIKYFESVLSL